MTPSLPHWDMTVVYPDLASAEFSHDFAATIGSIQALQRLFDDLGVGDAPPSIAPPTLIEVFERVLAELNAVTETVNTLAAYIRSFVATNSRNNLAQATLSELQSHLVVLDQLDTRFVAWIGNLDTPAILLHSQVARDHEYVLVRAKQQAAHLMSPAEEALAAALAPSAGSAWGKLHSNLTSQLAVPIEIEGGPTELPMSMIRNLAFEKDRELRRKGYEAELAGWSRVLLPLAAALNGIKGEVNVLAARRRWSSPLAAALFDNNIDQATLDAMLQAARESFPDFRRYLNIKAEVLGVPALAWYDMFAPVGRSNKVWEYDDARAFIVQHFGSFSARLRDYADRAFSEHWIDAEPRPGKRDGAFCMRLRRDESRIFANYKPAFSGMSTLAHELGHGYHNLNLVHRTMLQHNTPMTLAETASIFCQTIINQAALAESDRAEQIAILDESLQDACQLVVDISSRFIFEQSVFEQRHSRELAVEELNELMLAAQRQTYGDGLDERYLHPYMWAVKGHYYSTDRSFYNFPYMFGLLFGLGLYAQYQQNPASFRGRYDDLLASTGLGDAASLAARFDIDIRTPTFWRSSLNIIRGDIDRFEQLIHG